MTRKAILERAHVLNAASLNANAAMAVVASVAAERPASVTATYKCGDCATVFASNEGTKPFCVSCGSHHVQADASDGLPPETLPKDEQLAAFACASCGIHNVLSSAHLPQLKNHAHCVACGTVQNFMLAAEDDEQDDQQQQDDEQGDQQGAQQQAGAKPKKTTAGGGLENFGDKKAPPIGKDGKAQQSSEDQDQEGDQQQGDQQQAAADDETLTPEVPASPAEGRGTTPATAQFPQDQQQMQQDAMPGQQQQQQPMQQQQQPMQQQDAAPGQQQQQPMQQMQQDGAPMTCAEDDQMSVETVPLSDDELLQDDGMQADETPVAVELSLLAAALSADPKAELSLTHSGTQIMAMVGGLHVATLDQDAKPEYAGLFEKAPFAQSILHLARNKGIRAALEEYGFEKTVISVPVSAANRALIRRGVAASTKALHETTAALSDDLRQSLSLAATGLNKGFWKSKVNPLKAALAQTLASVGVSNPNRVLTNVFAAAGDAYVKTLLEAALELSGKSVEFRNELATNLLDMKVRTEASQEDEDPEGDDEDEDTGDHQYRSSTSFEVPAKAILSNTAQAIRQAPRGGAAAPSITAIRASVGGPLFIKRF